MSYKSARSSAGDLAHYFLANTHVSHLHSFAAIPCRKSIVLLDYFLGIEVFSE
jgi:hypothetical protein